MAQDITTKSIYFYTRQMKISNNLYLSIPRSCEIWWQESRGASVWRTEIPDTAAVSCRPEPSPSTENSQQPGGTALLIRHLINIWLQTLPKSDVSLLIYWPTLQQVFPQLWGQNLLAKLCGWGSSCKSPYKVLGTLFSEQRILLPPSSLSNGRKCPSSWPPLMHYVTGFPKWSSKFAMLVRFDWFWHLRLNMELPMIRANFQPAVHWQQSKQ